MLTRELVLLAFATPVSSASPATEEQTTEIPEAGAPKEPALGWSLPLAGPAS